MALVVVLGLSAKKEVRATVIVSAMECKVCKSWPLLAPMWELVVKRGVKQRIDAPYVSSKNAFSSCTKGEMQTHLASAAKIACSMVNSVVARVPIPSTLNFLHACRPSHVEGTFTHSLEISKSGCSRWQRLDIPVINMLESCSCVVP